MPFYFGWRGRKFFGRLILFFLLGEFFYCLWRKKSYHLTKSIKFFFLISGVSCENSIRNWSCMFGEGSIVILCYIFHLPRRIVCRSVISSLPKMIYCLCNILQFFSVAKFLFNRLCRGVGGKFLKF
jgi:hypothetical protein